MVEHWLDAPITTARLIIRAATASDTDLYRALYTDPEVREISYQFVTASWGQGFASEACAPVLEWARALMVWGADTPS